MFWTKKKTALSVDEEFYLKQRAFVLRNRVKRACMDTTNYQLHLMNFLDRNKNNKKLIEDVAAYRKHLLETTDVTEQEAARLTHEKFKH